MNKINYACTYAFVHGNSAVKNMGRKLKNRVEEVKNDESGMEIIAVVLILVVVIALAVIFKDNITKIFNTLWSKIADALNGSSNSETFSAKKANNTAGFATMFNSIA